MPGPERRVAQVNTPSATMGRPGTKCSWGISELTVDFSAVTSRYPDAGSAAGWSPMAEGQRVTASFDDGTVVALNGDWTPTLLITTPRERERSTADRAAAETAARSRRLRTRVAGVRRARDPERRQFQRAEGDHADPAGRERHRQIRAAQAHPWIAAAGLGPDLRRRPAHRRHAGARSLAGAGRHRHAVSGQRAVRFAHGRGERRLSAL